MACRQKKGRIFIVPGSTVTREPGSKFTLEKPVLDFLCQAFGEETVKEFNGVCYWGMPTYGG